jgi:hypothetical protein
VSNEWCVLFQLAKLVADEFFDQGDMEKLQLNITPIVSCSAFAFLNSSFNRLVSQEFEQVFDIFALLTSVYWVRISEQVI